MDIELSPEDIAFRDEVRAFLAANLPAKVKRGAASSPTVFVEPDIGQDWNAILQDKGWLSYQWPEEVGGTGWTPVQRYLFEKECALAGAPNLTVLGLKLVAPVIYSFGTPEQKAYYLPRILSGEDYWCQGFSEPGAGSDLASLKTTAVRDGDHYVINGQKTWTTLAQYAALSETLLASGARLPEVVGMVRKLEAGSEMEADLAQIEQNFAEGHADYDSASRGCRTIPNFFNWIVAQAGEEVASGFGHARIIYTSRAESKMQAFLYCFLPVNILLVGGLLLFFFLPLFDVFTDLINMMDNLGGS